MKKLILLVFTICLCNHLCAQKATINFYLTPSISAELLDKKGTFIKEFLEKETGLSIKMTIPQSYEHCCPGKSSGMIFRFKSSLN